MDIDAKPETHLVHAWPHRLVGSRPFKDNLKRWRWIAPYASPEHCRDRPHARTRQHIFLIIFNICLL
jgi:hypothetical protein